MIWVSLKCNDKYPIEGDRGAVTTEEERDVTMKQDATLLVLKQQEEGP